MSVIYLKTLTLPSFPSCKVNVVSGGATPAAGDLKQNHS